MPLPDSALALDQEDILSASGKYFELTQNTISTQDRANKNNNLQEILVKGNLPSDSTYAGIDILYIPTYERIDALDRALTAQTNNFALFGHKGLNITVVDSSEDKVKELNGQPVNYYEANLGLVNKFRSRGFNVNYIPSSQIESWKFTLLDALYNTYIEQLNNGSLDPRIKEELSSDNGSLSKEKLQDILFSALSIKNIAGKRTLIQSISQGKRIVTADDDALPMTRIPTHSILTGIFIEESSASKRSLS